MKPIIRKSEVTVEKYSECHDGVGTLLCRSMLDNAGSNKYGHFHWDEMPAGVSIGEHLHEEGEEIYFLVSGNGILIYDGVEYEMAEGDISVCGVGHSHGFLAKTDSALIVVY